jgi:hypothetical protein
MAEPSNEGPLDPHPEAVEIMARVDRMPKKWRELVHEFGLLITEAHRDEQYSVDDAWMSMMTRQETKQLEYATPFPPGKIRTVGRR